MYRKDFEFIFLSLSAIYYIPLFIFIVSMAIINEKFATKVIITPVLLGISFYGENISKNVFFNYLNI